MSVLWAALAHLSPLGLGLGAGGIAILLVALLGLNLLPPILVRPAILVGGSLLAAGAIYQTAYARATHAEQLRGIELARAAEASRTTAAETVTRSISAQAERDRAALAALNRQLEDILHAPNPSGDRVAIPRDVARRLRGL